MASSSYIKRTWWQEVRDLVAIVFVAFVIRTLFFGLYFVPSGSMEHTLLVGDSVISDKLTPWFTPIQRQEVIAFNQPNYAYSDNLFVNWVQRYLLGIFWGPQNWTKRVIAIAGDHVQGKIEDGKTAIYLNGNKLEEPYVNTYPLLCVYKKNLHTEQAAALCLANNDVDLISWDPSKPASQQPFYPIDPRRIVRFDDQGQPHAQGSVRMILAGRPQPYRSTIDVFDIVVPQGHVFVMGDNRNGSFDSRFKEVGFVPLSLVHGRVKYILFSFYDPDHWMITSFIRSPFSFFSKFRTDRWLKKVEYI